MVMDYREKSGKGQQPVLVVNLDVRDSHRDSVEAAPRALKLCRALEASEDWEGEADGIMREFEASEGIMGLLYTVCYY